VHKPQLPTRKIYILLTKFPDFWSKVVRASTGYGYSHTSIGLEEDLNTFYSFVCKGFIVEKITRYVKPDREPFPCEMHELEVTEDVYQRIKGELMAFVARQDELAYTKWGTFLCIMRLPYWGKQRYFCSYFVASILEKAEAITLRKHRTRYLPGDFRKHQNIKCCYKGDLAGMIRNYDLCPLPV